MSDSFQKQDHSVRDCADQPPGMGFRISSDFQRRTKRQKGELSLRDLEDIETRASSAYRELQDGWHFEHVIPNHDGAEYLDRQRQLVKNHT